VVAYLKLVAPTITVIDHVILSHPHRDHVELLPDVLANYRVRHVWDSGRVNDICGYRAFLNAVKIEAGVKYHNALQDFGTGSFSFGEKECYGDSLPGATITLPQDSRINSSAITLGQQATMTILHADGANHAKVNENSLVVRLDLGTTRILFMGDAEAGERKAPSEPATPSSIEGTLLACCTSDLAANILIVGHHGSKSSSRKSLLDAVNATVFVVSSGPKEYGSAANPVRLPDSVIITELEGRGKVLATYTNDMACTSDPAKVGPDNDQKPGGCDNIRITITNGMIQADVFQGSEP
jgi:competence protein ComEC